MIGSKVSKSTDAKSSFLTKFSPQVGTIKEVSDPKYFWNRSTQIGVMGKKPILGTKISQNRKMALESFFWTNLAKIFRVWKSSKVLLQKLKTLEIGLFFGPILEKNRVIQPIYGKAKKNCPPYRILIFLSILSPKD